jgi:hypothetical protein
MQMTKLKRQMTNVISRLILALFVVGTVSIGFASTALATHDKTNNPKLANYFLDWDLTEAKIQELQKWDVVILSSGAYTRHPQLVKKLKQLNPHATLLMYVPSQEIANFSSTLENGNLWKDIYNTVQANDWWLYSANRQKISTWPSTSWINASSAGKNTNGQQFTDYLAKIVSDKISQDNTFDGVFYDNIFDDISWTTTDIDIDNDGRADSIPVVNAYWRDGMSKLIAATKTYAPNKLVLGNEKSNYYNGQMNGKLREHFPGEYFYGWKEEMEKYINNRLVNEPKVFIINSDTNNIDNSTYDLRKLRFTYGSALLGDGYFSFDAGDKSHNSTWWYDEYNVHLGKPSNTLKNILSSNSAIGRGVWMREFDNGFIYLNTTEAAQTINLTSDLEKIKGVQAPEINSGAIVRKVTINQDDAIILQKRISKIVDSPFVNGAFVRPYDKTGNQLDRNGFFLFNNKFSGAVQIEETDINQDGLKEFIVADKAKIAIYAPDLTVLKAFYPFGEKYISGVTFSIGDINGDSKPEIAVATGKGVSSLVKIFSIDGIEINKGFAPFVKSYKGGLSITLAELNKKPGKEIVISGINTTTSQIKIFSRDGLLVGIFSAYDKTYNKGTNVSAGDLNDDGLDEIITGTSYGSAPLVKIFNGQGKLFSAPFFAGSTKARKGVQVFSADLEGDGSAEILAAVPTF